MKIKPSLFIASSLLVLVSLVGCSTSGQKTNAERLASQRMKISQLRSDDQQILEQIDALLDETEELLNRAEKEQEDDEDMATLVLDAAEAKLVQANTRRLYAVQRASYQTAQKAYIERASRIRTLRKLIETKLPATSEAN